jgi:uncharacterized protein YjiS (DUF1127 family)
MARSRIGALAERMMEARRRRQTRRLVAELPDRMLNDIGFARDWRGAVVRLPEGIR